MREIGERYSELMLKRYDVKINVMIFHNEDLNFFRYLIQHGWYKDLGSCKQLIRNLAEGKDDTLKHMDNKEQLVVIKNSGIGTCTIEEYNN